MSVSRLTGPGLLHRLGEDAVPGLREGADAPAIPQAADRAHLRGEAHLLGTGHADVERAHVRVALLFHFLHLESKIK